MTCTDSRHRCDTEFFPVPATQIVRISPTPHISITRAYCFECCEDAVFDAIHAGVPYAVRTLELEASS